MCSVYRSVYSLLYMFKELRICVENKKKFVRDEVLTNLCFLFLCDHFFPLNLNFFWKKSDLWGSQSVSTLLFRKQHRTKLFENGYQHYGQTRWCGGVKDLQNQREKEDIILSIASRIRQVMHGPIWSVGVDSCVSDIASLQENMSHRLQDVRNEFCELSNCLLGLRCRVDLYYHIELDRFFYWVLPCL